MGKVEAGVSAESTLRKPATLAPSDRSTPYSSAAALEAE